jgi:hypothetical protein
MRQSAGGSGEGSGQRRDWRADDVKVTHFVGRVICTAPCGESRSFGHEEALKLSELLAAEAELARREAEELMHRSKPREIVYPGGAGPAEG